MIMKHSLPSELRRMKAVQGLLRLEQRIRERTGGAHEIRTNQSSLS